MQDLEKRWEIGKSYHFRHKSGFWEGDVTIVGYGFVTPEEDAEAPPEGFDAVKVVFVGEKPQAFNDYVDTVPLNARYDWGVQEINICLENK